jgi:hypothetical protein
MKSCPEAVGRDAAQNFVDRTDAKIPDSFRRIQRSLASTGAGSDIQYTGPLPPFHRKSQFVSWFQRI